MQSPNNPFPTEFDITTMLFPLFTILILFILIVIMIGLYAKLRIFIVILIVFIFSLVMGSLALQNGDLPFSPYIQIFFILIQTIFFILTSINALTKKK